LKRSITAPLSLTLRTRGASSWRCITKVRMGLI
jgi:hypothetical protein